MLDTNNNINTKSIQREKLFYPQKGILYGEQKPNRRWPKHPPTVEGKANVAHFQ